LRSYFLSNQPTTGRFSGRQQDKTSIKKANPLKLKAHLSLFEVINVMAVGDKIQYSVVNKQFSVGQLLLTFYRLLFTDH
jgi:hypothetical protein